ncbi:chromosome partitioning protein, ParB family [Desulfotomaculum arcticum]|uniref:Chromosome partitioning protein, ParB family n=1 Tax=Desulfotruncus arcticus DSM 17038 TaxID=1121424 RepID=A0A1I2VMG9_9FIRM|nr:ParB/RepB/Spo0J family partition protein [Desulfotruncus arcticus]SFG90330.1 chromosome partitioning protein, ParB family [Desulfotomaculum arcticum] [Desulfotruncus arcticus DSM 17038]
MNKKRGLGKGLSALIPEQDNQKNSENQLIEVLLIDIYPNPKQPRQRIDEKNLNELMESIKTHGLIQPIIVRPGQNNKYEIIAGERRWQACKMLKMETVPVIIKKYSDLEASAAALIENIQREDLNAIEEASAYKNLMENYNLTQEELSIRVGKSRPFIANMVRILGLPKEIKDMLAEELITAGHARALIPVQDSEIQVKLTLKILKQQLSVRKTEEMVKKYIENTGKEIGKAENGNEKNNKIRNLEQFLSQKIGKMVQIKVNVNGSGKLIINYNSQVELINIIENIKIS